MHQLSGLDATFLYAEMNNSPMHIAPLLIYDPSTTGRDVVRFKDILDTFAERLDRSPVFRRKLAMVPLNLDQPYWVDDDRFDLEFHVRHIALPKPGDWRQLSILTARLHARPLDRSRPLWEAYIIEGLDNVAGLPPGCYAMLLKVHHAAIDGASGVELISALHDLSVVPPVLRRAAHPITDSPPSQAEMLWRACKTNMKAPFRLARLARQGIPAWRRVHEGVKAKKFRTLGDKERTRFNAAVSPHRVFGAVDFDLAVIRKAREAVPGATVNDAILSIVGGALRQYLIDKGELPVKSLVAGAPVNVRRQDEAHSGGNQVSMMSVPLGSDVADPLPRLQRVHTDAQASKAYHEAVGARFMTDMTHSLPAELAALGVRAALSSGLMAGMKPIFNTIVTNVPGPQVPLYMRGAHVVRSYGLGPCIDNMGLFHAVTSYDGQIAVSFQACRAMMPDPGFYEECLQQAYEDLQAALASLAGSAAKRKVTATKSKKVTTKPKKPVTTASKVVAKSKKAMVKPKLAVAKPKAAAPKLSAGRSQPKGVVAKGKAASPKAKSKTSSAAKRATTRRGKA